METQDLLFHRYSSPFQFIDSLIKNRRLYDGIGKIFLKDIEDKNWQVYLAASSNPCCKVGSFDDFIKKNKISKPKEMRKEEIEKQITCATSILNNFNPPNNT